MDEGIFIYQHTKRTEIVALTYTDIDRHIYG